MRPLWDNGYSVHALLQLFNHLPDDVRQALDEGLNALESLQFAKAAQDGASAEGPPLSEVGPGGFVESEELDGQGVALWKFSQDPRSGARQSLLLNPTFARRIFGMHHEELLARSGHSEMPLIFSELEVFCNLIDNMTSAHGPGKVRYVRVTQRCHGRITDAVLVRWESRYFRNGRGQLVGVQNMFSRVTPEEYDEVLERDPDLCRPLCYRMGDRRDADSILDDAGRDFLFDETFKEMTATEEGLGKLSLLAEAVRERFKPLVQIAKSVRERSAAGAAAAAAHTTTRRTQ